MAHVLVTGCSTGFGFLTALRFARAGDRVFATMRTPAKGAELERIARAEKLALEIHPLDVTDAASVESCVAGVLRDAGHLDVLVNNAGIELRSSVEDASDEDVRRQFETNVLGPVRTMRAVLPSMRTRRSGAIVNVSSIAGLASRPFGGYYAASKHAIEAITEALHFEVQPFGIRVALVEPGQYATRLLDNAWAPAGFRAGSPYWEVSSRFDQAVRKLVPGGELADPQEVADIIHQAACGPVAKLRWLAGADATMIAAAHAGMDFESFQQAMKQSMGWEDGR